MNAGKRLRKGFTLIELLTVIAIIAVLAAILFPVFSSVRKQMHRTSCLTQMHDVWQNVTLYYADNNRYPATLLGYAQLADGVFYTGAGAPVSIEQLTYRPLTKGQKYMKDKDPFLCPDSPNKDPNAIINAVYPANLGTPLANQAVVFNNLMVNNIRNPALFGPNGAVVGQNAFFYRYDSYGIGPRIDNDGNPVLLNGQPVYELHYSLDWTGAPLGPTDAPNQLKYPTAPSDSTVITWCTHHAATAHSDKINVIMLSGKMNSVPINQFMTKGPLGFHF